MTLSAEAVRGRKHGRSGGNMGQVEHMEHEQHTFEQNR